ncbi:MAG: outer membrane lipoprotein-sorting protein [Candidatus Thiodiazotropha sp. (ex Gloverina cf. vestifex)]|nr:outer membrane lipoprotein-sorting protein [Candidatus Thiodiazotropha sp. (ex Gloverina cf. vestifex)]
MSLFHKAFYLLTLLATHALAGPSEPEAIDLLRNSEALMRSDATVAEYRVDIIRPDWQRSMTFRSHDDMRDNRFRMEILSPRKTKGTVFLKVDNTLSMYLPKLKRRINISPAMMQDPWMGSDFNNQDLLETDSLIDDYTHRIIDREGEGNQAIITIESIPSPTATVTWKKLLQRIRADGMPLELEYHCKTRANRHMVFDRFQEMDGRVIPTRWTMRPLDSEGKRTVISLTAIEFNASFKDALFTPEIRGAKPGP